MSLSDDLPFMVNRWCSAYQGDINLCCLSIFVSNFEHFKNI